MILPDVNVLIYAFRRDVRQHALCRPWLESVIWGDAQFGVSPLALASVVRISTNPRAFTMPSAIEEAFGFCENLLGQPNSRVVDPGERHWSIFKRLCVDADIRGPRITDAWSRFCALSGAKVATSGNAQFVGWVERSETHPTPPPRRAPPGRRAPSPA